METLWDKEIEKEVWAFTLAGFQDIYGTSASEMGTIMGCSASTVSKMMNCAETRVPTVIEILSLCSGTGVSFQKFLDLMLFILTEKEGGPRCAALADMITANIELTESTQLHTLFNTLTKAHRQMVLGNIKLLASEDSKKEEK